MTELAAATLALTALIANYAGTRDEMVQVLSGPVDGGPAGTGLYPVTTEAGTTVMVPSLARIFASATTGAIVDLTADTVIDEFSPRKGDGFRLNGYTLTINRMADTPIKGLFQGAGQVIIKSGIARPEWWQTDSYRAAAVALTAGGGGDVLLALHRYPSESSGASPLPIARVRFVGVATPNYAPGFGSLVGGTIMEGPVVIASQGPLGNPLGFDVSVHNLGVDAGAAVCGVAGGGALEALVFPNIGVGGQPNPTAELRAGIEVRNVRALCKTVDAGVHGILVEAALNPLVEGCETVYGKTGIVLKTRGGTVRNCLMRGHSVAPGLAKSDAYAICTDTVWENCQAASITGADTGPFRIQAATASTSRHTFRDMRANGTTQWISIESEGANNVTDVSVLGGSSEGTRFGGITVSRINPTDTGIIARVTVNGVRINNVLETVPNAEYIGNAIYIGAAVDTMSVVGAQIYGTAADGIRSYGASVLVTGSAALVPGAGNFGFNALAGTMKVSASSNVGTTSGSVAA